MRSNRLLKLADLTKLAFIFVPLSTVCSAFGMNLREMDNHPTIWWFVAVSVLCTIFAMIVSSSMIRGFMKKFAGRGVGEKEENNVSYIKGRNGTK